MKIIILDSKKIENRNWYLARCNLYDYLQSLKNNFYEFAIQRKIVKNQYLDKLFNTVKIGDPFPVITLTYSEKTIESNGELIFNNIEILDGLQRSFRLWSYLKVSEQYAKVNITNYRDFAKKVKEMNPLFFETGVISTKVIKKLIDSDDISKIRDYYSTYDIYLTIWAGLNEKEVIQKMLVLNAGQKSVSKTHQFELLFLHIFDKIKDSFKNVKLFREKDKMANEIKRGNRKVGQYMFSSIIVSIQSLVEKKPMRVSTEKLIEQEFNSNDSIKEDIYDNVFNIDFIKFHLHNIIKLDELISKESNGKQWFSKDTTLSGIFAAIGSKIDTENEYNLIKEYEIVIETLTKNIIVYGYQLNDFTQEYNFLSSRSVNIGNFIRKVIMQYTYELIEGKKPRWDNIFRITLEK